MFTAMPAICNADVRTEGNGAEARFACELRLPARAAPGGSARPRGVRGVSAASSGPRGVRGVSAASPAAGPHRTPGAQHAHRERSTAHRKRSTAHRERALRPRRAAAGAPFPPARQTWTRAIDSSSLPLPRRETYSFNLH